MCCRRRRCLARAQQAWWQEPGPRSAPAQSASLPSPPPDIPSTHAGPRPPSAHGSPVSSRWVRREIRKLDVPDRERILRAMEIMYTTDLEEGRELYGKKFKSSGYFAATHSATLTYCYHWGIMFGTTHPAFQLEFEDSIRAIDPRISGMFYWDYFQDDARFGSDWWSQSEIYRDDWFGAVDQSKDDQYQVLTGRFAHTKVPTHRPEAPFELANYNSYGDMGQVCNQVSSSVIQRSVEFCGIKTQLRLASADDMISCFMNSTRLQEWDLCLEKSVHGNLHSLQGGAWDCNNDLQKMVDSDPVKYPQKVMDYIGVSSFNMWFKEMAGAVESFSCKEKGDKDWPCARDDGECAMLNKTIDYSQLTDVEIYEVGGNVIMEFMFETQWGNEFIEPVGPHSQDKELLKLGATYKWKHLPASEQVEFQRWLMEYASNPGKSGIASTGAAPADPLFWVWHSIFDRALHVLRMSEHFKSTYNMQWVPTSWTHCGGQLEDHLPFKNIFDDAAKDHHFTNKELWMLLDPTNQHLPYIYDDLTTWGEQYWDAFFLTVKKGQDRGDFANPDAPANDDFWKGAPESSESELA